MNYLLVVDDSPIDRALVKGLLERRVNYPIEHAATGWEALEHIESQLPLAVITDLQMPEMDGLQLTDAVRRHYGSVPVILMTAHGSEELAAEALARGAADYVPKSKLATDLCQAVENVLAVAGGGYSEQRLTRALRDEQLTYEFENDLSLIPPLVGHMQHTARQLNLVDEASGIRLARALVEAVRNAINHGNLELTPEEVAAARISPASQEAVLRKRLTPPYITRRIRVKSSISSEEGRFTVQDEGPGFDTSKLPDISHDPASLTSGDRRGLILIGAFMDEVVFNRRGNEITMIKRKGTPDHAAPCWRTVLSEDFVSLGA